MTSSRLPLTKERRSITDRHWQGGSRSTRPSTPPRCASPANRCATNGRASSALSGLPQRRHHSSIASEITEVARMYDKLTRTERMSEMGALVAGVAHEVRNPLFGISATLDAFEATTARNGDQAFVSALREQVDRMSDLIHTLRDYRRPRAVAPH